MIPANKDLLRFEYLAKKYDENNVPLYISYPTSSFWKKQVCDNDYIADLRSIQNPFLYVHFPFCDKVCHYCMCYKVTGLTEDDKRRYIQHLIREIEMKSSLREQSDGEAITNIHWGGGTPTILGLSEIESVFTCLKENFPVITGADTSFSIEAFPDAKMVTKEKIKLLHQLGFTEISFGIQDLDERVQSAINRSCKFDELKKLVTLSKENGLRVHIDLCYGLPFQELGAFQRTMEMILTLQPDRVAMLTYVHYPVIFENQRQIPQSSIPNSFMRVMLSQLAERVFTGKGYKKVGFDHYTRSDNALYTEFSRGNVSRDLMGYSMDERRNFIGFGSSAISFLNNTFYHNVKTLDEYYELLDNSYLPLDPQNAHTLTEDDIIRNDIIQRGILSNGTIDKTAIKRKYGIEFDEYFTNELSYLQRYEGDGLVCMDVPGNISLTENGKSFCRHIAAVFDTYYRLNEKYA